MPEPIAPALIAAVDFTPEALHITFVTGEFAVYEAEFLFDSRKRNDNVIIIKEVKM